MKIRGKKRLALAAGSVATVGAVATLIAGVTFGLFSATESSSGNSFTAGTVTVGLDTPASVTCNTSNVVPGDSSTGYSTGSKTLTECTYNVKYTGSANAILAVDVAIAGTAGTPVQTYGGSTPTAAVGLYDATANGLQLLLKDGTNTYVSGTSYTDQAGTGQTLSVNGSGSGSVVDLLVSGNASPNATTHFTIDYLLPSGASNAYQAASSTVTLTFHAVQAGNQTVPATCAAGKQCLAQSGLAWS